MLRSKNIGLAICVTLVLCMLSAGLAHAQTLNLTIHKKSDGFPGNDIYGTVQDPEGKLWFAGSAGIASFDGSAPIQAELPDSIGPTVKTLYCDSDGFIWFCTGGSYVGKFHYTTPNHVTVLNNGKVLFGAIGRSAIGFSGDGSCWVWAGGVFRSNDEGQSFDRVDQPEATIHSVNAMLEDNDGGIWFGGPNYIAKYRNNEFSIAENLLGMSKHGLVSCLYRAHNGKLYVGTAGLGTLQIEQPEIFDKQLDIDSISYTQVAPGSSFAANSIICIGEQADEKIWILGYAGTNLVSQGH